MSVLSAAALAGCGGESEQPQAAPETPAAPVAPAAKQPGAPRKAPEVVVSRELPEDFPADVPRYPGAEVMSARSSSKTGMAVVMTSGDPVDKVFPFLADSLAAEGWSTDIRDAPKGKVILADKGERTTVTHIVSGKDGRTRIRVLITQFAR